MKIIFKILPLLFILNFINIPLLYAHENIEIAKAQLDSSFNTILGIIKDPKFTAPKTRPTSLEKIEEQIKHLFDFTEFSSRATGAFWEKFTPKQKNDFTNAFADLLIYTYLSKIKNYNGEQIFYTNSRASASGKFVEIGTLIDLNNGKKIPVSYRMLTKNQSWYVYDVIAERISLVKNFKTQFKDILNKNSADELITIIQNKAKDVKASQE